MANKTEIQKKRLVRNDRTRTGNSLARIEKGMIAIVPMALAIGVAVLSRLLEEQSRPKNRAIEICVAECSSAWMSIDGVVRVYAERGSMDCRQIIVECSEHPAEDIPGEVDGHTVRIRVSERMGGTPSESAARKMVLAMKEHAPLIGIESSRDGNIYSILKDDDGSSRFLIGTTDLTPEARKKLEQICRSEGVSIDTKPWNAMGTWIRVS